MFVARDTISTEQYPTVIPPSHTRTRVDCVRRLKYVTILISINANSH